MKAADIRKAFLDYYSLKKGHAVVASSSLIPERDPTLLFTNAGMVQFKGVFLGDEKRPYSTAASCQKCMRAGGKHNDLENVGRTARHHTFFEMLGNFSFGDYFKEGAITSAWEFLTEEMKLPKERLWVTVYTEDDEAEKLWQKKAGVKAERIKRLGEKDNFWSMGDTGPCGPCSEIIIDQGPGIGCGRPECAVGCDCDRFLEIWNLVFMQFDRFADGRLSPLPRPSIDTGMGLERLTSVLQGKKSNYDTDLFTPIIAAVEAAAKKTYGKNPDDDFSMRAIADHSRAMAFLITDGVIPSNEGRGYVLRRIIRRAARHGRFLGIKDPFLHMTAGAVTSCMEDAYPELSRSVDTVSRALHGEEERFLETLDRGLEILDCEIKELKSSGKTTLSGSLAFELYDTYGFPVDLTADVLRSKGFTVDEAGFEKEMNAQREKARKAWKGAAIKGSDVYATLAREGLASAFVGYHLAATSSRVSCIIKDGVVVESASAGESADVITEETPFYGESGGQTGDLGIMAAKDFSAKVVDTVKPSPNLIVHRIEVTRGKITTGDVVELAPDMERRLRTASNHTATHILHAALRKALGAHVKQAGSLVTPGELRFDFSHFAPLTSDESASIENEVNEVIKKNFEVTTEVLPYDEAVKKGAMALFGEKYGDTVRLVSVKGVSMELCGGTHAKRTGDLRIFRLSSEGSVAAGVRRIEALTGDGALKSLALSDGVLTDTARLLKTSKEDVAEKVKKLIERERELEREVSKLKDARGASASLDMAKEALTINGIKVVASKAEADDVEALRRMADALRVKLGSGVVVLAAECDGKALILAAATKDVSTKVSAGEVVKRLAPIVGGKGGGKPELAQAGGPLTDKIDEAVQKAASVIEELSR